jgi:anti-sigma factor RsiW
MTCTEFDIRDYYFDELPAQDRPSVESHLAACPHCAADLAQLRGVRSTLLTLRDEEMPRRIGFVSDKIFEPSPVRRWFNALWLSGARLGFASAAMLTVGLLVFSARQQPKVIERRVEVAASAADPAAIKALVAEAVSTAMAQQDQKTRALLLASDRKHQEQEHEMAVLLSDYTLTLEKRMAANNKLVSMNLAAGSTQQ